MRILERNPVGVDCTGDKIRTKQSFKKETDINNIMARFVRTGVMTPEALNRRQSAFADVSEIGDFQTCHETIQEAQKAFMTLSAEIRSRFDNDPAKLLDFCQKDENQQEAIDLGIISKPEPTESEPETTTKPPAPSTEVE